MRAIQWARFQRRKYYKRKFGVYIAPVYIVKKGTMSIAERLNLEHATGASVIEVHNVESIKRV